MSKVKYMTPSHLASINWLEWVGNINVFTRMLNHLIFFSFIISYLKEILTTHHKVGWRMISSNVNGHFPNLITIFGSNKSHFTIGHGRLGRRGINQNTPNSWVASNRTLPLIDILEQPDIHFTRWGSKLPVRRSTRV